MDSSRPSSLTRFALTLAAIVVVIAGAKAAEAIIVPCILSAFMAVFGVPPMAWLQRKGVPAGVALILVVLLMR